MLVTKLYPTLCDPMEDYSHQAPLSMGFSRQEWSGLPFPSPGDHPNPGIKPISPASPALADKFFTVEPPKEQFKAYAAFSRTASQPHKVLPPSWCCSEPATGHSTIMSSQPHLSDNICAKLLPLIKDCVIKDIWQWIRQSESINDVSRDTMGKSTPRNWVHLLAKTSSYLFHKENVSV